MDENNDVWLLLASNLPVVAAMFIALQRGWIYIGRTFDRDMKAKDDDILYRESLRREALEDKKVLHAQLEEQTKALKELSNIVEKSLLLNEQLMDDLQWKRRDENNARR